jgi:hypothetical protein
MPWFSMLNQSPRFSPTKCSRSPVRPSVPIHTSSASKPASKKLATAGFSRRSDAALNDFGGVMAVSMSSPLGVEVAPHVIDLDDVAGRVRVRGGVDLGRRHAEAPERREVGARRRARLSPVDTTAVELSGIDGDRPLLKCP